VSVRYCALLLFVLLACDDETSPIDASSTDGAVGDDAEGMGCGGSTYAHVSPTTSTLRGSGFEEFEDAEVRACLTARQSFAEPCGRDTIEDGAFAVTATVCTAGDWVVFIDRNGDGMFEDPDPSFRGPGGRVTPADFACGGVTAGAPAPACDEDGGT
jgi:hypothetical protein